MANQDNSTSESQENSKSSLNETFGTPRKYSTNNTNTVRGSPLFETYTTERNNFNTTEILTINLLESSPDDSTTGNSLNEDNNIIIKADKSNIIKDISMNVSESDNKIIKNINITFLNKDILSKSSDIDQIPSCQNEATITQCGINPTVNLDSLLEDFDEANTSEEEDDEGFKNLKKILMAAKNTINKFQKDFKIDYNFREKAKENWKRRPKLENENNEIPNLQANITENRGLFSFLSYFENPPVETTVKKKNKKSKDKSNKIRHKKSKKKKNSKNNPKLKTVELD